MVFKALSTISSKVFPLTSEVTVGSSATSRWSAFLSKLTAEAGGVGQKVGR